MQNVLEKISENWAMSEAQWLDAELKKLIPEWMLKWYALMPQSLITRATGIVIESTRDIGNFDTKYRILQRGKVVAQAKFHVNLIYTEQ